MLLVRVSLVGALTDYHFVYLCQNNLLHIPSHYIIEYVNLRTAAILTTFTHQRKPECSNYSEAMSLAQNSGFGTEHGFSSCSVASTRLPHTLPICHHDDSIWLFRGSWAMYVWCVSVHICYLDRMVRASPPDIANDILNTAAIA